MYFVNIFIFFETYIFFFFLLIFRLPSFLILFFFSLLFFLELLCHFLNRIFARYFSVWNNFFEGFLPILEVVLLRHYFVNLIDRQDSARRELNVLLNRQFSVLYPLLSSFIERQIQVSVSIDNSADDVSFRVVKILNNIWAVSRQVHDVFIFKFILQLRHVCLSRKVDSPIFAIGLFQILYHLTAVFDPRHQQSARSLLPLIGPVYISKLLGHALLLLLLHELLELTVNHYGQTFLTQLFEHFLFLCSGKFYSFQ